MSEKNSDKKNAVDLGNFQYLAERKLNKCYITRSFALLRKKQWNLININKQIPLKSVTV